MAAEWKAKGNAAFSARNYSEAVRCFTEAINRSPKDHVLYSNRSGAYAATGSYENALEDAQRCVALNPSWPKGYSRVGFAQLQLGDIKGAIATYEKGLALDPENAALKQGLQEATMRDPSRLLRMRIDLMTASLLKTPKYRKYCEESPDFEERLKTFLSECVDDPKMLQLALSVCPDPRLKEAVMEVLGIKPEVDPEEEAEKRRVEEAKRAEEARKKAKEEEMKKLEETPEALAAKEWRLKGNELYKKRDFKAALEMYDKAIEANPKDISLLNNKAAVFVEMGELQQALDQCNKALEMRYDVRAPFEKVAKVYLRLSTIYKKMNDYTTAVEMMEKSLMEDNTRQTRAALAELKREKTKKDEEAYIDPVKAEEHRVKGNEFFKQGDYPAAKREYDEGVRRNPNEPRLYGNRAAALMKLLDLPGALKDTEKSLALDPSNAKVWARKGNILTLMKDFNKALAAFEEGLKVDSTSNECMTGMTTALRKIQENNRSGEVDQEQVARAMADPEIQALLSDPQFNLVLKDLQQSPETISRHLKNPKVAEGLQKLMAAGILKMG